MNDIKPLVVVLDDRHNGKYSGGKWTAWNMCYAPSKIFSDEKECADFFAIPRLIYGRGETPEEAIEDLKCMLHRGSHIHKEIVKEDTEDEEDKQMKATSVQKIKNVKDICFSIENYPIERESKLTIVASTNDDIFAFEFEGPDLFQSCKKAGLLAGRKISELEKENKELKAKSKDISDDNASLLETNKKLKEENVKLKHDDMLDKENADYWLREYSILSEMFDKLQKECNYLEDKEVNNSELTDNVNHPSHYTGKYECIDVMQDVFGDEATNDFCLCNAFKYIWRARKKNGLEDVKKAVWYLNKYIEEAEKDGQDKSNRRT